MLKEETTDAYGDDGGNNWSRVCGTCRSAACTVYCRADSAYLCAGCDARIHAANHVASRHERVRVCEACERAPAAFLCKADAASLCTTCDAEIHSANPLARRHIRVPILPISASETAVGFMTVTEEDEDEAASWLLPNPGKTSAGFLFGGGEVDDQYMDLMEYNSSTVENQFTDQYTDSVVPIQSRETKQYLQNQGFQYDLEDYYDPSKPAYSYNSSITQTVSISCVDIGVVPESTLSDNIPISGPPIQMPSQLTGMDREARVLRYREKKKTRKFEKTIRYASRKAYAETRPRIKGRFAKRTDVGVEVDQMFSTTLMTENGYGIVPSF